MKMAGLYILAAVGVIASLAYQCSAQGTASPPPPPLTAERNFITSDIYYSTGVVSIKTERIHQHNVTVLWKAVGASFEDYFIWPKDVYDCIYACAVHPHCLFFVFANKLCNISDATSYSYELEETTFWSDDIFLGQRYNASGEVRGDPRFDGFDGSVFWFHGKRDMSWCISSDRDLHINAYFIGKSMSDEEKATWAAMGAKPRDLTWVGKISFLFGQHSLVVSAIQEKEWTSTMDHLSVYFDGVEISLPNFDRKMGEISWTSPAGVERKVTVTRINTKNQARVVIDGLASVVVKIVPTKRSTWTATSSFPHIDAQYSLLHASPAIDGVLGRTMAAGRADANKKPYTLRNLDLYSTSDILSADCKVSQFSLQPATTDNGKSTDEGVQRGVIKVLSCTSEQNGVACR